MKAKIYLEGISMSKVVALFLFLLVSATGAFAASETIEEMLAELEGRNSETITQEQQKGEEKAADEQETDGSNPKIAFTGRVTIRKDTEVLLKLVTPLKSGEVAVGQVIEFLVEKPVVNNSGMTLIEKNAMAYGTITATRGAGGFGQSGKIDFTIDRVAGSTGIEIPLRTQLEQKAKSNVRKCFRWFLAHGCTRRPC